MNGHALTHISRFAGGVACLLFSGVAAPMVDVYITPDGGFSVIPGIAVVDQSVATITLNADEPFQVTLRDDNNGMLKSGNTPLPYTIKYNNGSEITLSTSTTTVETGVSVANGNRSLTVFIGASASIGLPAGTYSTTITVEILAI
jgi:hypothetical protein